MQHARDNPVVNPEQNTIRYGENEPASRQGRLIEPMQPALRPHTAQPEVHESNPIVKELGDTINGPIQRRQAGRQENEQAQTDESTADSTNRTGRH